MFLDKLNQTGQRIVVSIISIIIVLFSIFYAKQPRFEPVFVFLIGMVICFALHEYYRITEKKGFQPLKKVAFATSFIFLFSLYYSNHSDCCTSLPLIILWLALIGISLYFLAKGEDPLGNSAITYFGLIYLTLPLSCLVLITYFFPEQASQDGRYWLIYLLLVAKMTDTAAFFAGSQWGRHKMTPYISPKKSWEGAIAGLLGAVATSLIFIGACKLFWKEPPIEMTLFQSIWIALIIGLLAQIGDLAESLFKRDGGVKDSSHLPGLGGMLDIVDSLVFTTPFIYFVLKTLH